MKQKANGLFMYLSSQGNHVNKHLKALGETEKALIMFQFLLTLVENSQRMGEKAIINNNKETFIQGHSRNLQCVILFLDC